LGYEDALNNDSRSCKAQNIENIVVIFTSNPV